MRHQLFAVLILYQRNSAGSTILVTWLNTGGNNPGMSPFIGSTRYVHMVLQDFFSKSNLMDKNGTTALPLVLTYMISSSSLVLPLPVVVVLLRRQCDVQDYKTLIIETSMRGAFLVESLEIYGGLLCQVRR